MSYTKDIAELEEIVRMMQSDKCDIDHLTDYTKRAAALITKCREALVTTEQQLADTLESLRRPADQ